jgi:hypothetical protein
VEIRPYIWQYVGLSTAYSAFLLVTGESSRLIHWLRPRPTCHLEPGGRHLFVTKIIIFGTEYIRDFYYDETHESVGRDLEEVTGATYVISANGDCAIKLFGPSWETGWFGKTPAVGQPWYGRVNDIPFGLHCSYNASYSTSQSITEIDTTQDLNCDEITALDRSTKEVVLWDQINIPSSLGHPDSTTFDLDRDHERKSRAGNIKPKRRFLRYLALYRGDECTTGLTIFIQTWNRWA